MFIPVTDEFLAIIEKIEAENKSTREWALMESDDMFQSERFVGSYDADEEAFCFSCFDDKKMYSGSSLR